MWGAGGVPRGVAGAWVAPLTPALCQQAGSGTGSVAGSAMGGVTGSAGDSGRVRALQQEVEGVKTIMTQNVERILARGENLEQLHSKSQDLEATVRAQRHRGGHGVAGVAQGPQDGTWGP